MSQNIEDRVVEMKFNNSAFEAGVAKTMSTLQNLKEKLNFQGAGKGLNEISNASNKVDLSHISRGIDEISGKFSAMSVAGITAFATLVNRAVDAGLNIAKSFTLGPIGDGFNDYNAKLTSVQTVMNTTGKSIGYVSKYFDQLDTYADQTIFSMSDMTSAFAKFTNAGIDIKTAVPAIKGIGNLTALAGQGADSAQVAYYNLAQSLSGGFLTTTDYKSLNLANVATKEFRDRLVATAVAAGTVKSVGKGLYTFKGGKKAVTEQQLFSESLSSGWANAKILTDVLNQYGDASKGVGQKAFDAATKVKTLPQLMQTLRAQVGTGWTETFQSLLGNVTEATDLFTGLSNTIGGYIDRVNKSRNSTIKDWRSWGGRAALIQSIKNAFHALQNILKPIHDAFRQVFPKTSARMLASLTIKFRMFTEKLIASKDTMDKIRRTFVGVFTVIKIVVGAIALGVKGFFNLFRVIGAALPGFLSLTAVAGDFIQTLAKFLIFKNPIAKFFKGMSGATADLLIPIVTFLSKMADALASLAKGDISGFTKKFKDAFSSLSTVVDAVATFIEKRFTGVTDIFVQIGDFLSTVGKKLVDGSSAFGKTVGNLAAGLGKFLAGLGSGAGEGFVKLIDSISSKVKDLIKHLSFHFSFGGIDRGAKSSVKSLTKLQVVGTALKSIFVGLFHALKKVKDFLAPIVGAVGSVIKEIVLKVSEYVRTLNFEQVIAMINTGFLLYIYRGLGKFLKASSKTVGKFGKLADNISGTFNQLTSGIKTMQRNVTSKVILRYAIAIGILAASAYFLAKVDPVRLGSAVAALALLAVMLNKTLGQLSENDFIKKKGFVRVTFAMDLLAIAILGMAIALKVLASISAKDLAKGLAGIAALMAVMVTTAKLLNGSKGIVGAAIGIGIISIALISLAGAIKLYAKFKPKVFSTGLKRVAEVLVLIGLAFRAFPAAGGPAIAGALLIAVVAITLLVRALKSLAHFTKGQMAKALIGLGGALLIISLAMDSLAAGGEIGAAALLVIAVALRILIPALVQLGQMHFWDMIQALLGFAGVLIILGGASFILAPLVPVILGLAIAVGLLGIGLGAAGAGVFLFSTGLALLGTVGTAALAGILALLPVFATQVGLAIVAFFKVLNDSISELVGVAGGFIVALAKEIAKDGPILFRQGIKLVEGLLDAFNDNATTLSAKVLTFMLKFEAEVESNAGPIINAGVSTLLALLQAFADALEQNKERIRDTGYSLGEAIGDAMKAGIAGAAGGTLKSFFGTDFGIGTPKAPKAPPNTKDPGKNFPTQSNSGAPGGARGRDTGLRRAPTVTLDIDTAPTITPVVDLTEVNRAGRTIADLMSSVPIIPDTSTVEARNIASSQPVTQQSSDPVKVAEIKFEQTNNSPRALSRKDIYRRTNNQLAQAKQVLGLPLDLVPADA